MIRLDNAGTRALSLITAQNGADVTVGFSDYTIATGAYVDSAPTLTTISSATTTTICATPASGVIRDIDYVNVKNTFAGSHTMTLQITSGSGGPFVQKTFTLLQNESITFTHGGGYEALSANAGIKTGGIDGPSSSTDNAFARWDGTTGTVIQNSGVTCDDSNNVSGVVNLTATGVVSVPDGTAAAPSVKVGDEQNGLYSSAANNLDITLNGTRAINLAAGIINTGYNVSTGDVAFELGVGRSGNGNAYIDLHAESGGDYDLRLQRASGTNGIANLVQEGTGRFYIITNSNEGLTQDSSGCVGINHSTPAGSARLLVTESATRAAIMGQTTATGLAAINADAANNSYASSELSIATWTAAGSGFNFWICQSDTDGTPDTEAYMRGDGQGFQDAGTAWSTPADYAEFMESLDGKEIPVCKTVVLQNGKIRPATALDKPDDVIGVIRPRSGVGSVVANAGDMRWGGKYLKDSSGDYILEDYEVYNFTEIVPAVTEKVMVQKKEKRPVRENYVEVEGGVARIKTRTVEREVPVCVDLPLLNEGGEPVMVNGKPAVYHDPVMVEAERVVEAEKQIPRSYASYKLPQGVTVRTETVNLDDGSTQRMATVLRDGVEIGLCPVTVQQKRKLNPAFDAATAYLPRRERPEWNLVGMVGQVEIEKGQPVNPRWRKMKDLNATQEKWFIR